MSPRVLLTYRAAMFAFGLFIGIWQLLVRGIVVLKFFTVWNWWGLVFYFAFTAAASLRVVRSSNRISTGPAAPTQENDKPGLEDTVAATLFHMLLPVSFLPQFNFITNFSCGRFFSYQPLIILTNLECFLNQMAIYIDLATWLVLVPMLRANPDYEDKARWEVLLFSFFSYAQHILNCVMLLGDFVLNRIPLLFFWGKGCLMAWSILFGIWGIVFYHCTGRFIYPFLDITRPNAFRNYYGLLIGGWGVYLLFAGIMKLKQAIVTRKTRAVRIKTKGN